jgi:putative FmdB family regulatory protein
MPIYEYQCESCGREVEKLQRLSDAPLRDCPDCGEAGLKRLISAAGFRLKGGGWYETDFKKDGKRNLHDGGKAAGSAGSESADPKPAAKPVESKKPAAGANSGTA